MKEQIKEIARVLCEKYDTEHCKVCDHHGRCMVRLDAEWIYDAGYRKQSEWISVEDRLPEGYGEVLCYCDSGSIKQLTYNPRYQLFNVSFDNVDCAILVTHWMPLPEPPKMKGGAE